MKKIYTKLMMVGAMLCAAPMFGQLLTPELLYYKFDGTGTNVPNYASAPPVGTTNATLMGGLTQGPGTTALCSGSMIGTGVASSTDYLNTGYAPSLTGMSWTISFRTANFGPSSTLFYIFGDANSGSFRCFTNGVAGPNNWILRGTGITDAFINGGAVVAPHIATYVYSQPTNTIYGYLDGVLVSTTVQAGTPVIAGTGPFKVFGYATNVGAPAGGQMDEFRLYSRALTQPEITMLANPFTGSFLGSDINFCNTPALSVDLDGYPFGSALWSTGSTNDTISVSTTGTYYVDVTGNCGTGSDTIVVGTLRTTASMNDIICGGNYTAPSGAVYTMPGTYMDTIPNVAMCDSVITITLTGGPPTTSSFSASSCVSYTAPSGAVVTSSGTIMDTIPNAVGCDSIMTIAVTILSPTASSFSASACDMYMTPSGAMVMSSGTVMDTIPNMAGCDSVMTINVTILNSTSSTMSASSCDMYTAPSGAMYMMSGTYMDTISNMAGCDSIITINLTIINSTTGTLSATACDSYTAPSGAVLTMTGTFMDTIANMAGCDSVITINLMIMNSSTASVTASTCGAPYTAPSGAVYTTSGTYMDTITNMAGCDSVITIALTVTNVNAGATAVSTLCTATGNTSGATFQWIDCSNMTPVAGATSSTYTATANGSYAVIITNNSCVDTSNCVTVSDVSVAENTFASNISLYPNPSSGEFNINLGATYDNVSVVITDLAGRTVFAKNENSTNMIHVTLDAPAGSYIVTVMSGNNVATFRIVTE